MKKALSAALILGSLYGTANAAPITSPIYMPESGGILMEANIGYAFQSFDDAPSFFDDEIYKSFYINLNGKVGIIDRLSLNYDANLSIGRSYGTKDISAKFNKFSGGLTGRVVDAGMNKFDIILNIGQEEVTTEPSFDQIFVDVAFRYGLELEHYNLGLSINGKYLNGFDKEDSLKYDNSFSFGLTLENKIIFTKNMTMGVDLFYRRNGKVNLYSYADDAEAVMAEAYNEYGIGLDFDYGFTENLFLGLYGNMNMSDMDYRDANLVKDTTEYKFGLRLTSKF